jgi:hypothetical protein
VSLEERLASLGRDLVERELQNKARLEATQACAKHLHDNVSSAIEAFNSVVERDAAQLTVSLSEPRVDDKHLHAVQFELARGRHRAIVTIKSRGEVTLVGPYRTGKTEGPCRSFPTDAEAEIGEALAEFLAEFIEEAASP